MFLIPSPFIWYVTWCIWNKFLFHISSLSSKLALEIRFCLFTLHIRYWVTFVFVPPTSYREYRLWQTDRQPRVIQYWFHWYLFRYNIKPKTESILIEIFRNHTKTKFLGWCYFVLTRHIRVPSVWELSFYTLNLPISTTVNLFYYLSFIFLVALHNKCQPYI